MKAESIPRRVSADFSGVNKNPIDSKIFGPMIEVERNILTLKVVSVCIRKLK